MTARRCTVVDCKNLHYARGFCQRHYAKARRIGLIKTKSISPYILTHGTICEAENCTNPYYAKGFCEHHYKIDLYQRRIITRKDSTLADCPYCHIQSGGIHEDGCPYKPETQYELQRLRDQVAELEAEIKHLTLQLEFCREKFKRFFDTVEDSTPTL